MTFEVRTIQLPPLPLNVDHRLGADPAYQPIYCFIFQFPRHFQEHKYFIPNIVRRGMEREGKMRDGEFNERNW